MTTTTRSLRNRDPATAVRDMDEIFGVAGNGVAGNHVTFNVARGYRDPIVESNLGRRRLGETVRPPRRLYPDVRRRNEALRALVAPTPPPRQATHAQIHPAPPLSSPLTPRAATASRLGLLGTLLLFLGSLIFVALFSYLAYHGSPPIFGPLFNFLATTTTRSLTFIAAGPSAIAYRFSNSDLLNPLRDDTKLLAPREPNPVLDAMIPRQPGVREVDISKIDKASAWYAHEVLEYLPWAVPFNLTGDTGLGGVVHDLEILEIWLQQSSHLYFSISQPSNLVPKITPRIEAMKKAIAELSSSRTELFDTAELAKLRQELETRGEEGMNGWADIQAKMKACSSAMRFFRGHYAESIGAPKVKYYLNALMTPLIPVAQQKQARGMKTAFDESPAALAAWLRNEKRAEGAGGGAAAGVETAVVIECRGRVVASIFERLEDAVSVMRRNDEVLMGVQKGFFAKKGTDMLEGEGLESAEGKLITIPIIRNWERIAKDEAEIKAREKKPEGDKCTGEVLLGDASGWDKLVGAYDDAAKGLKVMGKWMKKMMKLMNGKQEKDEW